MPNNIELPKGYENVLMEAYRKAVSYTHLTLPTKA